MFARTFVLLAASSAFAQTWTPDLQMQIRPVAEVVPSPDGAWVAWTETRAVLDGEKSENLIHVHVGSTDGARRFQLTRGDKSASAPAFSPDSRFVYFTSERSGKKNLYRIAIAGGEAEKLTDWQGAMGAYEISPDGKWIAFAGREPESAEERAKKEKTDFRVIDENPKNHALWVVAAEGGKPRRLFSSANHTGAFDWSPDSRRIAFEHRPTPDADIGRRADISEVEVESGVVRALAVTGATESQPRYSPDGRYIAFVRSTDPPSRLSPNRIALLSRADGAVRDLPLTPDESPSLTDWAPDSRRIFFTEARGTRAALYAMPADGPPVLVYRPAKGTFAPGARLNRSATFMGLARQSPSEPPEAYVLRIAGGEAVQVSRANLALKMPVLGETKLIHWKAKDGLEIEGLLTLPVNYVPGTKVPLVLNIHGGPAGVFGETFVGGPGLYPIASFSSKGIAVLRSNPRGSTGYGGKFRRANLDDWGNGDYNDLMSGVDTVVAQGIADPNRLAVMGWSYGGYMTAWVVSQTTRFKAAAVGAGLTNLWSMWGTNDIPSVLDDYFSGSPWQQFDAYFKRSPLAHIANATTPTLFLHGENDLRVPIGQAHEMYSALKRRGVKTQMVVYPRSGHGPTEPKFVLDIMQRHLDWAESHLK